MTTRNLAMQDSYAWAREEAKRLALSLGHKPGRFHKSGHAGSRYYTLCKTCHYAIGASSMGMVPWHPYGRGTTDPCKGA